VSRCLRDNGDRFRRIHFGLEIDEVNTKKKLIASAAVLAAALSATAAQASDGTITINGQINDQTCTVTNGTNGNFDVTLPTVQSSEFKGAGQPVGHKMALADPELGAIPVTGEFAVNRPGDLVSMLSASGMVRATPRSDGTLLLKAAR
jgi:hypothetical protein